MFCVLCCVVLCCCGVVELFCVSNIVAFLLLVAEERERERERNWLGGEREGGIDLVEEREGGIDLVRDRVRN